MHSTIVTEQLLKLFAKEDKKVYLKSSFPKNEFKNVRREAWCSLFNISQVLRF